MSEIITNKLTGKTAAGNVTITSEGGSATMQLQQGLAKCWINFQGSSTITTRDSLNVSSMTDDNTGLYTISFTDSFSNNDYAGSGHSRTPGVVSGGATQVPSTTDSDAATGTLQFYTVGVSGSAADFSHVSLLLHGDLA